MSRRILVIGTGGQVGSALVSLLGDEAIAVDADQVNLAGDRIEAQLDKVVGNERLRAVINAAAYTAVDLAETERDKALRINGDALGTLGAWCKKRHIPIVHYSTDYVFDGSGTHARNEEEPTAPLNYYGASKLEGEKQLAESGADYLVFRTSWVYDAKGKNFALTMMRLFRERETISVVDDQVGAPTYAPDLAQATLLALLNASAMPVFPRGIYHLCHAGHTSWYGFAKAIFALASSHESGIKCSQIKPVATTDYPTPAKRPLNSRLDCSKAANMLSVHLPDWSEGLKRWQEHYENH